MNNTENKIQKGWQASPSFSLHSPETAYSWIEINASALKHNVLAYKSLVGPSTLLAPVIKADAYGHGILAVGSILNTIEDVGYLCVAHLSEALTLRKNGITKPLVVLSVIDIDPALAIEHSIDLIAYDFEVVSYLNQCAQQLNKKISLHIKIDTGLSRMGVLWSNADDFITQCSKLSHCTLTGIFSHFANSEGPDKTFAKLQLSRFKSVILKAASQGIHFKFAHISSSAGHIVLPEAYCTLTRLGIGLYGLWPSSINKQESLARQSNFYLEPVMEWKTKINQIKDIPAGSFVGYDLTHTVTRDSRIAILPIGYHDGYDRRLSNKAKVKINGHYAPVIGRVAMNLTMIDITDIPDVKKTDTVTLLGADEMISAETLAQLCGTINYEFVSRINPRIRRIVI